MTTRSKTTCDGCGEDPVQFRSCEGHYLTLYASSRRHDDRFIGHSFEEPFDGSKHFCNFACLQAWLTSHQRIDQDAAA